MTKNADIKKLKCIKIRKTRKKDYNQQKKQKTQLKKIYLSLINKKNHKKKPEIYISDFFYTLPNYANCFSNFSFKTDLGTAPICLSTISPFLKNNNAGMLRIP